MPKSAIRESGVLLLGVATMALAMPAIAQDTPNDGDIVVTARQRSESLIRVPVAVSAVGGSTLERAKISNLSEVATIIPNLTISKQASGTGAALSIRGVGSTFNDAGIEQTVQVNIDGVALSRGFITSVAFLDVGQVEVLKGPQALFFGKNSPAGVVSVRSNNPGATFEASLRGGYEFVARQRYIEGMISGPLTPTLGARLAVRYDDADGWMYNDARAMDNPVEPGFPLPGARDRRTAGGKTLTARGTLLWQPSDAFTANLKLLANHYKDNGTIGTLQALNCAPGQTGPGQPGAVGRVTDPYGDCQPNRHTSIGDLPADIAARYPGARDGRPYSDVKSYLATLKMDYDLGALKLTSVTGYNDNDLKSSGPFDVTTFARYPGVILEKGHQWTQELRFNTALDGALQFAGGAYYESAKREVGVISRIGSPPVDPATGNINSTARFGYVKSRTLSVFGQALWDITPELELAGGVRYTHERKDTDVVNTYVNPAQAAAYRPQGLVLSDRFRDSNLSPEATLTWHPEQNLTIYAAYKAGYKSGGASVPVSLTASTDRIAFGPEKTRGGEIGFKGTVFDRRLTFSSAIYHYKITGLQLTSVQTLTGGIFANFIANAATARTQGVEAEASFRANRFVTLRASAAYNEANITKFANAPCYQGQTAALGCVGGVQDRSGDPLSKAPRWVGVGGADLAFPLGGNLGLGFTTNVKYTSSYRTQDDGAPYAAQRDFVLVDASLRLHDIDDKWELALIGRNLGNEYYIVTSSPRPGGLAGELYGPIGRPREIALQGTIRF
ncbi:MAG: TonB-dependent receptor [Sphingobium sp.]